MSAPSKNIVPAGSDFFEIRIQSVQADRPLPYDLYLWVGSRPVLFRKRRDELKSDRAQRLIQHGGEKFFIPNDQRVLYMASLKNIVHDPSASTEDKSKYIKETAFVHVNNLFTKQDVAPIITEAQNLIEDMVSFVSTDIDAVASLLRLSTHDYYTYNHCVDVAVYSIALAKRIWGEDRELLKRAGMGGLLHDIGKRNVPIEIINKKSKLTPEEWDEIKRHPSYGKNLIDSIPSISKDSKLVVLEHHENFDGTGYPSRLKGDEISKLARLVSIADVFDALTTNRSYHHAIKPSEALGKMFGMQPGKFDPQIFKQFNQDLTLHSDVKLADDFDPCSANDFSKLIKKLT